MTLDLLTLSRIQAALQLTFHIIFPTINIGLAAIIFIFEFYWIKTQNSYFMQLCKFFTKIFALAFGLGVVSGITLSFMFGTNFAKFSIATSNVIGPLLSYEVLTAFFLEATFLGVMIFGWQKVTPKVHFFATTVVFIGTLMSAFWILSANSWMQTPRGYFIKDGIFYPENWIDIIFNPSFGYRYTHMILASIIAATAIVAGISAYYLKREVFINQAKISFSFATYIMAIIMPIQIIIGDLHGLNTFKHQPMKVAAIEGHWETQKGAPLILFGLPNKEKEITEYKIQIPKLGSIILAHDIEGVIPGLKEIEKKDRPNVKIVFFAFRIMVGIGLLFLTLGFWSLYLRYKNKLFSSKLFFNAWMYSAPLGVVATISGWYVTECGRFPWIVYGLMKVEDSLSAIDVFSVILSLSIFAATYTILFIAFAYYLRKIIKSGLHHEPKDFNDQRNLNLRTAWLKGE